MSIITISQDFDALMTETQASEFLQMSVRTLQAWRLRGGGPSFAKAGRSVRYRRRDLLAWVDARMTDSTSMCDGGRDAS